MLSSPGRFVVLLMLCAVIVLPLRSEEKLPPKPPLPKPNSSDKKTEPGKPPAADSKKTVEAKKFDWSSLPADAILVLCERGSDALPLPPNAVILSPSKYQEMRDEIERLRKQLQTDKPVPPTRCDLRGKVEPAAVRLEAEFSGMADSANTLVTLACPQAGAASAQTDGRMALIRRSESGGFVVRVDRPGEYHVKLELVLPLTAREGNGRGFELTLPRAAITNLELDLPANSKDLRVGGRSFEDFPPAGLSLKNHHLSGNPGLEPVDKLDLSWKEVRATTGDLVRTSEGRIRVQVDAGGVTTEADLLLRTSGPPTKVWRLLVPRDAEMRVKSGNDERLKPAINTNAPPKSLVSTRTIDLKEASSDPLEVHIKVRSPLPRGDGVVPIGPFAVLDAAQQTGTVVVRNQLRNLHLDYSGHGDMQLRSQQTEETSGDTVATLVYSNIPLVENPKEPSGPRSPSWLDLAARPVHAHLRTRVLHTLMLRPPSASAPGTAPEKAKAMPHWEIITTIAATKGLEGESLKIVVPPQWQSNDDNVTVVPDSNPRCVAIPASMLREPYQLTGRYETPDKAEWRTLLQLPRPQGTLEQCEVKIEAPAEYEVILHNAGDTNLEASKPPRPNEQTWHYRNVPANGPIVDVSWRPYRPELRMAAVADVTLNGDRARVHQEMKMQLPAVPPPFVDLRVPPGIGDIVIIDGDNRPQAGREEDAPVGVIRIPVQAKAGGTEWRMVLDYLAPLGDRDRPPRPDESFTVPLVTLEQATTGDIKVRVWSEAGLLPRSAGGTHWEERAIEEVKGRDLPVLVLHTSRLDVPLVLRAREQAARFAVLIERALVRVTLLEGGVQHWHTSYQLRQLADKDLDILMPGPVATLNAQFLLNGHKVKPDLINEEGEHTDGGNIARLHLSPELIRKTALLEVKFQSLPGRAERSPLQQILHPPQVRGAPAVPTRWLVSVPSNRVLLAPESAAGVERTWMRRGWLLAARLQRSAADLEREFDESLPAELRHTSTALGSEALAAPALVCWQDHTAPLVVTQAPQQGWLLMCSLGLLIVGLGLYWAARPSSGEGGRMAAWFWPLLAVLTLAAAICMLFWPTTTWAVLYGCEPGAIVLLGVVVMQWLMHQRYRRQIVFLPSFSRGRAGSSLMRKPATHRPLEGEPSTVDAPPPVS